MRALYVDDDDDLREIARLALGLDPGIEVRLAASAAAAMALLGSGWQPDVALIDVRMPGDDGFALCARLREGVAALPVIFVTGNGRAADLERCHAAGATAVIVKPFDALQLAARVRSALAV